MAYSDALVAVAENEAGQVILKIADSNGKRSAHRLRIIFGSIPSIRGTNQSNSTQEMRLRA